MATKQKQKSQQTRSELKEVALRLIAAKGYENTSVADIVNEAGYSVGAFYGHFKTKQELVRELWVEYVTKEIEESVEKGSRITDKQELVDYLIMRSNETSQDRLGSELHQPFVINQEATKSVGVVAARYTGMLENALLRWAPNAPIDMLWTCASMMHSVLNAHAQRFKQETYYSFDNRSLSKALLLIIDMCEKESANIEGQARK